MSKAKHVVKKTVDGDIEYTTVKQAAKSLGGADPKVIQRALDGKMPTAYGFRWVWKEAQHVASA